MPIRVIEDGEEDKTHNIAIYIDNRHGTLALIFTNKDGNEYLTVYKKVE